MAEMAQAPKASSAVEQAAVTTAGGEAAVGHGDPSISLDALTPHAVVRLQRLAGNRAMSGLVDRRRRHAPGGPAVQRSVYLANADDHIYKSEADDEEYAFLYKYAAKYPLFIKYAAIDALANDRVLNDMWTRNGNVEAYFKNDLVQVLKRNDAEAQRIKALVGVPALYDNQSGTLAPSDLGDSGLATVIAAAKTGGAKVYQQGGGSRLPSPFGILTTLKKTKHEALAALGIPQDRWPEYRHLALRKLENDVVYNMSLAEAKQNPASNLFEYSAPETDTFFYYISAVEARRNANARIQIAGTRISDTDFFNIPVGSEAALNLQAHFAKMPTPLADSDWIPGTQLNKKDRGEGQAKAMNSWNALGAAAYANKFLGQAYPLDQNWEWLHVRGAQIGGVTDGTNLVPGLYVTNSFMIPYESLVAQWAQADATKFWARFQLLPAGTLFGRYIKISILAKGHSMLGNLGPVDLVTFDALAGRVVDKLANEIVKRGIDRRAAVEEL